VVRLNQTGRLRFAAQALAPAILILAWTRAIPSSPAPEPRPQFVNIAREAGLSFVHENGASKEKLMPETFGAGVAVLDYDNDGWVDIFYSNGARMSPKTPSPGNALYRNVNGAKFEDVTRRAGISGNGMFATGATVGDYDNDGYPDIFVSGYNSRQLFRNRGDGTFADVTQKAGVAGGGWSSSAAWLDYDRDGHLDLYVVRYLDYDIQTAPYCGYKQPGFRMYCDPQQFDGVPDQLFHNNGDGTFSDVSAKAGIANRAGKGLGVSTGDIDMDGWPEIFVTNDGVRNFLYHNRRDGTFEDITYTANTGFDMNGKAMAGMGTVIADYDDDGLPDIFLTAFSREYNTLYRNLGKLTFDDVTLKAGLQSGFVSLAFGTRLFDFDNDGDLDIHCTNGHVTDNVELYDAQLSYRQSDLLYENIGGGKFKDVSAESGPAFKIKHVGRGSVVADIDNDGDLDIVIADCGGAALLFRNDGGNRNNWLMLKARGRTSNRFGVGVKVRVTAGGVTQYREINPTGSYLSTSDVRLHLGLGKETAARLDIEWPGGKKQTIENARANQALEVDEADAK
jgi:enediyne biosynthesis protein E4